MNKYINLIIGLTMTFGLATQSFASQILCESANSKFRAFMVFDDGPGGLDALSLDLDGQSYTDVDFDNPKNPNIVDAVDSLDGKFEYGGDTLELGFKGENSDIFINVKANLQSKKNSNGTVLVKRGRSIRGIKVHCAEE